jgi:hypothetical protein
MSGVKWLIRILSWAVACVAFGWVSIAFARPVEVTLIAGITFSVSVFAYGLWREERMSRAYRRGLCLACGYDLRATPDRLPGVRGGFSGGAAAGEGRAERAVGPAGL